MGDLKIQWHPAFCSAMELILEQDREYLEFIREYNLNTKPLEVDLLVIKKPAGYEVEDEIGRIFREHNIFEYKPPDDAMNIDTFYKVIAYAALYKASARHVDGIRADSVTITLIREAKPEKLLNYLEKEGFTVRNDVKGIYYIEGKSYFPTQVVVSKELTGRQHIWLRALTKRLDQANAEKLVRQAQACKSRGNWELADSVLEVSVKANHNLFSRIKEDSRMCEALRELMADEIHESMLLGEKRGEQRGEARGEKKGAQQEKAKGLKALVDILKGMHLDFDSAYQSIRKTEAYADISKEQLMKYWQ